MRISEAMRLGAMVTCQAFHTLYDYRNGGTCANGAVLMAMGVEPHNMQRRETAWDREKAGPFMDFLNNDAIHPISGIKMNRATIIINLNNDYRWSREQIADWVETLEPVSSQTEGRDPVCSQTAEMVCRK